MTGNQRKNVLAIVLAGGEGKRLMPLTADRAKPAVPYAGIYRLIDFALSNVVNSGYLQVVVLTQYKSHSLDRHISQTWRMSTMLGNYVTPVPAQQRVGKRWYLGSADAIFQSLNLVRDEKPDIIVVVGADHIYRMDFAQMVDQHVESGAGCTVAAIRQPIGLADQFGVIDVQPDDPQTDPRVPREADRPGRACRTAPNEVLASMGNYVFDADALVDAVTSDAMLDGSKHDMGGDIVPAFVRRADAGVYDYKDNLVPGSSDRDRGVLARRRDARLLLRRAHGRRLAAADLQPLQLRAGRSSRPTDRSRPPSWSRATAGSRPRRATPCCRPASWSAAGRVHRSVLSPAVRVESGAQVTDSVLMHGVKIGAGAVIRNAIIDKNVVIPPNARIGVDEAEDKERGFVVEDGLTVLGKEQVVSG